MRGSTSEDDGLGWIRRATPASPTGAWLPARSARPPNRMAGGQGEPTTAGYPTVEIRPSVSTVMTSSSMIRSVTTSSMRRPPSASMMTSPSASMS